MEKTPKLLRLNPMHAAYVYSLSQNPEEEALSKITQLKISGGLGGRLFGRNIYPTDQPEPHGYEYYLTVEDKGKLKVQPIVGEVPGGLYAVLDGVGLFSLSEDWKKLFMWVEASGYGPLGVKKGVHGWVNSAFEEFINWQEQKPPNEWVFRLMVQVKE
ncbi:MAG: GyrI-like domain-containing protein [Candidatus Bathyarchaeota archaeon]|nr:GyrI-like domain-containing protein [Candidatus Bathyarchaeota archaeon]